MSKFMYFVAFSENFQKKKNKINQKKNLIWIVKLKKNQIWYKAGFLKEGDFCPVPAKN